MLKHQILRLHGDLVIHIAPLVFHLILRLVLREHSKLQTSDLIFDILVVFFHLAILNDLLHQLLQLIVVHGLSILLISGHTAMGRGLALRSPLLAILGSIH